MARNAVRGGGGTGPVPVNRAVGPQRGADTFALRDPDAGEDRRSAREFTGTAARYPAAATSRGNYAAQPCVAGSDGPDDTGGGTASRPAAKAKRSGQGFGNEEVNAGHG